MHDSCLHYSACYSARSVYQIVTKLFYSQITLERENSEEKKNQSFLNLVPQVKFSSADTFYIISEMKWYLSYIQHKKWNNHDLTEDNLFFN